MLPMKGGMQNISNHFDNYLGKDRTESESYQGVQTFIGITENNLMEVHLGQGGATRANRKPFQYESGL